MVSIERIRRALGDHTPAELEIENAARAAVALVIRDDAAGPEALFIERASHEDDPWSGHMAFPGGRVDRDDAGARAAAERETLEEVGVRLDGAEQLGRLDDKRGRSKDHPDLIVSAFIYRVHDPEDLVPNHEVREAFWFPLPELLDPSRRVARPYRELSFPGILIGEPERHVVWGLTYSFLEAFFVAMGTPLPNRWPSEMRRDSRGPPESTA